MQAIEAFLLFYESKLHCFFSLPAVHDVNIDCEQNHLTTLSLNTS